MFVVVYLRLGFVVFPVAESADVGNGQAYSLRPLESCLTLYALVSRSPSPGGVSEGLAISVSQGSENGRESAACNTVQGQGVHAAVVDVHGHVLRRSSAHGGDFSGASH